MMKKMFTLLRATGMVCTFLLGAVSTALAQCPDGETAYEITLFEGGNFVAERSWQIIPTGGTEPIISQDCGDYASGTFEFCLVPGVEYDFVAFDDFGDGWNLPTFEDIAWSISYVGGPVVVEGTNPNGCNTGDFSTDCIGQCEEARVSFFATVPPSCTQAQVSYVTERSCDDFNYSITATIDEASSSLSPLLVASASSDGIELSSSVVPNLAGQVINFEDLPLDQEVVVTVNALADDCPVSETFNITSIGCPVPLTCGEAVNVTYCYDNFDTSPFVYESPEGEPIVLLFQEGLIESCCDDIFIYDGFDATGELLFSGNNGGNLAGIAVTANSGAIALILDTDLSVSCATNSFGTSEWNWIVGCGEIPIPGCTDPSAINYIPEATEDDGSCIFPAENDEACGAVVLECNGTPLTGNFDAASISDELTNCGSTFTPPTGDLWFQFDADGESTYLISAENGPDMVVALYSGDDCGNLTEVEGCSDFPESFSGVYEAGTYYFLVRPFSGSAFNNSYEVSLTCVNGAPENDEPCGALSLECNGDEVSGTFLGATETLSDECFGTGTADIWLTFEADGESAYNFSETSFSDVIVSLYSADACEGELTEIVACSDFPESFGGVYDAGTYYVRIRPFSTALDYSAQLICALPPSNDLPCNAIEITCESGNISGTTLGATLDDDCGGAAGGAGVWYVFNSDIDGTLRLNTCQDNSPATTYDSDISILTGTCDNLTCSEYLDGDAGCGFHSDITFDVFNGETYYILVHGWNDEGNFDMEVTCEEIVLDCPGIGNFGDVCDDGDAGTVNDVVTEDCQCAGEVPPTGSLCGAPIEIASLPYQDIDNTSNFGDDYEFADLPPLAPGAITNGFSASYFGGDDVVYAYTPTEDQFIDVTVSNHDIWVGLFVIEGCPFESTVGSHTSPDNLGRAIEALPVSAGTTYYIVISTFPPPQNSPYQLDIEVSGFDCPDQNADFGDPCDDGIEDLFGSTIQEDCSCDGGAPFEGCNTGALFGTRTITCEAPSQDIFGSWTNEYSSILGVESGLEYTFTLSIPDYFITVTDADGITILALGQEEVVWTADFSGDIRFYSHFDGACSTTSGGATTHTRSVTVNCDVASPECEEAMMVPATAEFADSEIDASMIDAVPSGTPQCVNAENPQADRWFSFESITTNMYIRAAGADDFDAVVEVYDECGGTLLFCQNDAPAGEKEVVQVTNTTVGETYYFRVYHAGNEAPVQQNFAVATAHIPFTQLSAGSCGVMDYTPADMITTALPVNQFLLENWYFEFTELEEPFNTYEILSPNGSNPNFLLQWFTQAEYGRTYEVRTRARMYQGPQLGDYGEACVIGFSSVPLTTQLIDEQALGFFDMCDILEADNVPGATTYRWRFFTGFDADPIVYDSPNRFCQLGLVEGLQLGSPYGVVVRVLTQGISSPNGEIRLIAMNNFVPETGLDEFFTTCGSTVDLNTVVTAVNICAAEFYTFRFTNLTDANQPELFYTRDDGLRSINLSWVPGLNEGDTYAVQVLGGSGGLVGEYGYTCELTIAGGAQSLTQSGNGSSSILADVEMELYPNPTSTQEVMLTLTNLDSEQQEVRVEIHDLYGKKVHSELIGNNGSQLNTVIQLPELAMGIYTVNVMVNQEQVQAKKLVVR